MKRRHIPINHEPCVLSNTGNKLHLPQKQDLADGVVSVRVIPVSATDFCDVASDAFRDETALMKSVLGSAKTIQSTTLQH
jgi:hypothetical protein